MMMISSTWQRVPPFSFACLNFTMYMFTTNLIMLLICSLPIICPLGGGDVFTFYNTVHEPLLNYDLNRSR
jgi:hypothetical protein